MTCIRWAGILFLVLSISVPSLASDHQLGVSVGVAELYGDLKKFSDLSPSIRLTYEMIFNPYFSVGLEGGFQQIEGRTWVTVTHSPYRGPHPYKTTIFPGGIFGRIHLPTGKLFHPYIEGGAGIAMWMSEHNPYAIPPTMKTDWARESFVSWGGGIFVNLGESWGIDVSARARYYFTDNLDRIDWEYLAGEKGINDYVFQGGIALVYRFGAKKDTDGDGILDKFDKAPDQPEDIDGFKDDDGIPDLDNDGDGILDARDGAPNDPEDIDGFEDEDGVPDPDNDSDGIPDSEDPFPNIPQKKELGVEESPYTVHVASFRKLEGANREIENYKKRGYEAFKILTWIPQMGRWYRVYVGHFKTKAEAQKSALELIKLGYTEYAKVMKLEKPAKAETETQVGYYVHVSSFKNKPNAQGQMQVFSMAGYQAIAPRVDLKEKGFPLA